MNRAELDVSKFLYDPFDPELVGKLSKYGEFSIGWGAAEKYKEGLCRYIVLCYDFESPLRHRISDLSERKALSATMGGLSKTKSGKFPPVLEDALVGANEAVSLAVTKYLMLFGKPEFLLLEANMAQFAMETATMLKQAGDKDTVKTARELAADINRLTRTLYGGEEPIETRKALYQRLEERRAQVRPEDLVKRISEGSKLKDYSPYGDDYDVEPMKFMGDSEPST